MEYKFSNYNLVNKNDKGQNYIYNVLTKKCYLLSELNYNNIKNKDIEKIINNTNCFEALKSAGMIIEKEKDEIEIIDYNYHNIVYNDEVLELTIIMTQRCNFKCIYCYQNENASSLDMENAEKILKFIEISTKKKFKKVYINWFGGEPLLMSDLLIQMSERIVDIAKKNKFSYIGRITTNGYLLTQELFKKLLKAHIIIYMITVDGSEDYHNKQRPLKQGGETYNTIIKNLVEIRQIKKNFIIDLRVNVSTDSYNHMEQFLVQYEKLFENDKRINLVMEAVHDWHGERIQKHKDQVINNVEKIKELYKLASNYNICLQNYLKYDFEVQVCIASKKNGYFIAGDASVHKCEMAMNDDYYYDKSLIGFIDKNGNLVIDKEKEIKWLTRSRDLDSCYDCIAYPYCMGGAQCNYGMKFHKNIQCEGNRAFLEWTSAIHSLNYAIGFLD